MLSIDIFILSHDQKAGDPMRAWRLRKSLHGFCFARPHVSTSYCREKTSSGETDIVSFHLFQFCVNVVDTA